MDFGPLIGVLCNIVKHPKKYTFAFRGNTFTTLKEEKCLFCHTEEIGPKGASVAKLSLVYWVLVVVRVEIQH